MKKAFTIIYILLSIHLYSQNDKNIWYFGIQAGLNFNSGTAVPIFDGALNSREGVTTQCNKYTGNLLFYSDGTRVINRLHATMPNGGGLLGNISSTQSAISIPNPADSNKYYLITTDNAPVGYHYSEIDMSLNGGLGDVILATKNTLLYADGSEKLTVARHCNKKDYWIITHETNSDIFRVFLVNSAGISAPATYAAGTIISSTGWKSVGQLKVSPDGSKLACVQFGSTTVPPLIPSRIELFNFDNTTGVISPMYAALTDLEEAYGCEFSPNSKLLYVSQQNNATTNGTVVQYNLSSNTASTIMASKIEVSTMRYPFGSLQLGPDNKIYVAREKSYFVGYDYLGVINQPDNTGAACDFVDNAILLLPGKSLLGLPTIITSTYFVDYKDTTLCIGTVFNYLGKTYTTDTTITNVLSNSSGCDSSFTYYLKFDSCIVSSCKVSVPDAFTPNADTHNDVFKPYANCTFDEYIFRIFNRWGELLYETTNAADAWDGSYKQNPQSVGVYVWTLQYSFENENETKLLKGNVSLLR